MQYPQAKPQRIISNHSLEHRWFTNNSLPGWPPNFPHLFQQDRPIHPDDTNRHVCIFQPISLPGTPSFMSPSNLILGVRVPLQDLPQASSSPTHLPHASARHICNFDSVNNSSDPTQDLADSGFTYNWTPNPSSLDLSDLEWQWPQLILPQPTSFTPLRKMFLWTTGFL